MSRFLLEIIINNIRTDTNELKQYSVNKWKEVKAEQESAKYLFCLLVAFSTFNSSLKHRHVYRSFAMMCRGYSPRTKCKHLSPKLRTRKKNCMFQRTLHTVFELFER